MNGLNDVGNAHNKAKRVDFFMDSLDGECGYACMRMTINTFNKRAIKATLCFPIRKKEEDPLKRVEGLVVTLIELKTIWVELFHAGIKGSRISVLFVISFEHNTS